MVRIAGDFIPQFCLVNQLSSEFIFGNHALDSLLLVKSGVHVDETTHNATVKVCNQCHASLSKKPHPRVPKFALKNKLYRGHLPQEFQDLTWVEEQVCAIYRATAFVTRLSHSDDPPNPHVFHGNTCAHNQNVVLTAKVLPRTSADINDSLTVVFVGPGSTIPLSCLKNVFRIRKEKVRRFLLWLKHNNRLYSQYVPQKASF